VAATVTALNWRPGMDMLAVVPPLTVRRRFESGSRCWTSTRNVSLAVATFPT
jgi:hypothetical protein